MKIRYIHDSFWTFVVIALAMTSCSDDFLQDKKDYNGFNEEIYNDIATATAKVDYIYNQIMPNSLSGSNDSEEMIGLSDSSNPTKSITVNNVGDDFWKNQTSGPWARIRECNLFLEMIDKGTLDSNADEVKYLKGQVYFWRAWLYWSVVKLYGGVPIVLKAQNAIIGGGNTEESELAVPRSSTADCVKQICRDLDDAANNLPGRWDDANWGRITSGAAAALKGRVLLTFASPLFNRTEDVQRWKDAYEACKKAKTLLEQNNFSLADGTGNRAEKWEEMFVKVQSEEAVMLTLFNNKTTDNQMSKNNGWEQSVRPKELLGGGGIAASLEIVDMFPMADGKRPDESTYTYDELKFYKNRDPRFYRTFAFNGVKWPYASDSEYTVWNYQWYANEGAMQSSPQSPAGTAEYSGTVSSNVYVRKRSNPNAKFDATYKFSCANPSPVIEIRFAEVVLNLAEAAAMSGELSEAYELLKDIRKRVGYTGECGLSSSIKNDKYKMVDAILYERLVEFAYEGKRAEDLRRWLLYNDDYGFCTKLGYTPLQGTRRHGLILAVNPDVYANNGKGLDNDIFNPLSKNFDERKTTRKGISLDPSDKEEDFNAMIEKLDEFYDTNLIRLENNELDSKNKNDYLEFTWKNEMYLKGIKLSVLQKSPYLEQNIGWKDYKNQDGTFDPTK